MNSADTAFHYLSHNRACADDIPDRPNPGVYAVFAKEGNCLPGIILPPSGLVYIGETRDLKRRNHFNAKHSGFSTLRRSIGAILKTHLHLAAEPRAGGPYETNYRNFRFEGEGEERLTQWMHLNLEYSSYPCDGDTAALERRLIREYEPPLNLNRWRNPQKAKIQSLRDICKVEAKLIW